MSAGDAWAPYRAAAQAGRAARAAFDGLAKEEVELTKSVTEAAAGLAKQGATMPGSGPTAPGSSEEAARRAAAAAVAAVRDRIKTVDDAVVALAQRRAQAAIACPGPPYVAWSKSATDAFPEIEAGIVSDDPAAERAALARLGALGVARNELVAKLRSEVEALTRRHASHASDARREVARREDNKKQWWSRLGEAFGEAAAGLFLAPIVFGIIGAVAAPVTGASDCGGGCSVGCWGGAGVVVLVFVSWLVVRTGLVITGSFQSRAAQREFENAQRVAGETLDRLRAWLAMIE
jgi:hypothetical protein